MANDTRSGRDTTDYQGSSKFQQIGLFLALAFYVFAVVMVNYTRFGITALDPNAKSLTIAHWQLEDGFREGIQDAIDSYMKMKAEKGESVRITQNAIPTLTYPQWHLTQLISGNPADIVEISGTSDAKNRYYTALSPYIGDPNPYNNGTPLEGIPWRDTFFDDMNGTIDLTYADYYGMCLFTFTTRMYVNLDLLSEVTGSEKLPEDVAEWLRVCRQIAEFGKKTGRPLIPIGAAGTDRRTIGQMFVAYNSQMTTDLNDFAVDVNGKKISINEFADPATSQYDQMIAMENGVIDLERFVAPIDLLVEIGEFFAPGFTAIDLQTTKFLFASGNVCFFAEGSWAAFSMVNNSPFRVTVMDIPPLAIRGEDGMIKPDSHPLSKYFVGIPSEIGSPSGGQFGIPKRSKHFELSLDFMRYLTSYNINQKVIVEYTKWLSPLKKVEYAAKPDAGKSAIDKLQSAVNEINNLPGLHTEDDNLRAQIQKDSEKFIARHNQRQSTVARDAEIMRALQPKGGEGYTSIYNPILVGFYTRIGLGYIENLIQAKQKGQGTKDPGLQVYRGLWDKDKSLSYLVRDQKEAILGQRRTIWSNESLRSFFELGKIANEMEKESLSKQAKDLAQKRAAISTVLSAGGKSTKAAKAEQQVDLDQLTEASDALNKMIADNKFNAWRLRTQLFMSSENAVGLFSQMTTVLRLMKFYNEKYAGKPGKAIYRGNPVLPLTEVK